MKRLITVSALTLALTASSLTLANAEIVTYPCGAGSYKVDMPSGILQSSSGCTGDLVIDSSVKTIASSAFSGSKITSVVIPNSVTSIGNFAFWRTGSLKSAVISNSLSKIENWAFDSTGLTSVVIPDSVKIIGYQSFYGTQLTSVIIPDSVTSIESSAFAYSKLSSVKIGRNVTSIGSSAFSSNNLTTVDIPDGVNSIGSSAFSSNNSLRSITYCGPAFASLPTTPTCPPDRKAIIDAANKAAADKAAADKAAADARAAADRAAADAKAAADRAAIQAAQEAKKLTITCKKGKITRQVRGETPTCPKGFVNPLAANLTFQAYSICKLYKKDSPLAGVSLLDGGKTLKFSYAGKYSSYMASAASYLDVSCALSVMKAPSFVTSQIDTTRALDGLQKASWGKLSAFWTYHPDSGLNISMNTL